MLTKQDEQRDVIDQQKALEAARAACRALEEQARRAQKLEEKLQRFCYEEKAKKRARAKRAEELFNKYAELDPELEYATKRLRELRGQREFDVQVDREELKKFVNGALAKERAEEENKLREQIKLYETRLNLLLKSTSKELEEDLRIEYRRKDPSVKRCILEYEEKLVELRRKLKRFLKHEKEPRGSKTALIDPELKRQLNNARRNQLARDRKLGLAPPPVPRQKKNSQRLEEGPGDAVKPTVELEDLTPEPSLEGGTTVSEISTTGLEGNTDSTSVSGASTTVLENGTESPRPWDSGLRTPPTPGRSPEPEESTA